MSEDPAAGRPVDRSQAAAAAEAIRLDRRRFFRAFVSDAVRTAAHVVGVAGALQRTSAEMAGAILAGERATAAGQAPGESPGPIIRAGQSAGGFRSPFRLMEDMIVLLDQRRLPDELVEVVCRTAPDVRVAIMEGVVRGAPLLGQVAACAVAVAAAGTVDTAPYARRAIIHGSANSLRNVAGPSAPVRRSIERMMAVLDARRDLHADGPGLAAALRAEAEAIVGEATLHHAALARHGAAIFAEAPVTDGVPLRILTLGSVGALAGGQVGTVLAIVHRLVADGRVVEVVVCETRPSLTGTRLTGWELSQTGVPYELIPDAGAGALLAAGDVDIVLAGAEAVAENGDVLAEAGTCGLALLAAHHGIPFVFAVPGVTIDLDTRDGSGFRLDRRPADEVLSFGGRRVAPAGATARHPGLDVTPAGLLVGAIVTEEGILERPLPPGIRRVGLAVRARGFVAHGETVDPSPDDVPSTRDAADPAADAAAEPEVP